VPKLKLRGMPVGGSMVNQGDIDPDLTIRNNLLIEAMEYWRTLQGDRRMPSHDDIDPMKVPRHLLPHLELVDVIPGPIRRLRWRLIGTHITAAVNRDATGQYFDEYYFGDVFTAISGPFDWVIENRQPLRWSGTSGFAGMNWQSFESVLFPLSRGGETVEMIMGAVNYELR
jgi:hypothetical protein